MFVVAGVSGKVGSVVAQELLDKKQTIKVIVRNAAQGQAWSKRGAEVAVGSLEDSAFMTTALKNATGFFALLPPNYAAADFYGWQKKTGEAITTAVKQSGVKNVVLLSSIGADLADGNGPVKGLHHLENGLRATGTTLTAIRAGYFQENLVGSLMPAIQMGVFVNFNANVDHAMAMIASRDIGLLAAKELIAKHTKNEIVDLQGPTYSNRQQALMIGALLGKRLNIVDVAENNRVETFVKAGFPQQVAEAYSEMHTGFQTGKIVPKGDRIVQGTIGLEETLRGLLAKNGAPANPVGWFEIPVKNLNRATLFYENVLQQKLANMDMGPVKMAWFPAMIGANGAAGTLIQGETYEPSQKGSLVYVSVDDIEATLVRVKSQGGKVLNPKTSIGEHGFVAHFEDSEGNRVALHSVR